MITSCRPVPVHAGTRDTPAIAIFKLGSPETRRCGVHGVLWLALELGRLSGMEETAKKSRARRRLRQAMGESLYERVACYNRDGTQTVDVLSHHV
jgi:hypothetical protein